MQGKTLWLFRPAKGEIDTSIKNQDKDELSVVEYWRLLRLLYKIGLRHSVDGGE